MRYHPRLDGVRAIAVLLVITSHCFAWAADAGSVGVGTFFVLSGFLITSILDVEYKRRGDINLRNFYVRRALRLYPALVVVVSTYLVGVVFGLWAEGSLVRGFASAAMALTYTTDVFTVIGKGRWVELELLLTWTLAVEEQFYVVWPLVFRLLLRRVKSLRTQTLIFVLAIFLSAVARLLAQTQAAVTLTPIGWADALLVGCLAGLLVRRGVWKARSLGWVSLCLLALPGAALVCFGPETLYGRTVGLTLFAFTVVAYLLHALAKARTFDVLGSRLLARLGKISYGVYIWHSLILSVLLRWLPKGTGLLFIAEVAISVAVAEMSYRLLESPFLLRKVRFQS